MRERLEEAVDHVSLDVMVQRRRARGLPAPEAGSARDRAEFEAGVKAFLERLAADLPPALDESQRRRVEEAVARAGDDRVRQLIAMQVVLARDLPDYWQRFEEIRIAYTAEQASGSGEPPGFLRRLFGR